jgi:hypothetical protein
MTSRLPTIAYDALPVMQDDPTGRPALNGSPVEGFSPFVILNIDDMVDDAGPRISQILMRNCESFLLIDMPSLWPALSE